MKPISQLVVVAAWLSLRSLPPKEAIVAFVVTDIVFLICVVVVVYLEEEKEREVEYIRNGEGKHHEGQWLYKITPSSNVFRAVRSALNRATTAGELV